ncbi:unnamed protein product [Durusdinium trenchii]|uniref:Uncharacterized protein n=1 Tax=Durusdinium trenchii TaxID=1381693 RepID=A0ABP0QMS1_9DINO
MGCSYSAADSIPSRVDVEQCVPVDSVEQGTPEAAQVEVQSVHPGTRRVTFQLDEQGTLDPEAKFQFFLKMVDHNPELLECRVARKRRRDFGVLYEKNGSLGRPEELSGRTHVWQRGFTCRNSSGG